MAWVVLSLLSSAIAITLNEAFQAALQKSESPRIHASEVAVAEEKITQGWGAVLPKVSLIGGYTRQERPDTGSTLTSSLAQSEQTTARLNLTQPLFHGMSDFYVLKSRYADRRAAEWNEKQSRMELFQTVAQNYYAVLTAEAELTSLNALRDLSSQRVAQLKDRTRIGRSRKGELLAAQAQLATVEAQKSSMESEVSSAREAFALTTLLDARETLDSKTPSPLSELPNLDALEKGIGQRWDVQIEQEKLSASEHQVSAYWGQHLPSLDFAANYHLKRPDYLSDVRWDFGLQLTIPIFSGGVTQSQIREAAEQRKQAELALALTRRTALKELKSLYADQRSKLAQLKSLETALSISEANYKEQNKDYGLGLVTNLDVISALNQFYETKRTHDRTRYQLVLGQIELEMASGSWKEPS